MTPQETEDLAQRILHIEQMISAINSRSLFSFVEAPTREDLASLHTAPPAIAYCHEDGGYYFKYPYSGDLAATPYHSLIGDGWHNMESPCPRYDRPIHIVKTQWLNGWNLDYYPDYIDISQGGRDEEYLQDVFSVHHGPPSKSGATQIYPKVVKISGDYIEDQDVIYLTDTPQDLTLNPLCTFAINNETYGILDWSDDLSWIQISPGLLAPAETGSFASLTWPSLEEEYSGTTPQLDEGATEIELYGLEGPIDTSYILVIGGVRYQILDYDPQGAGSLPTNFVIEPGLATAIDADSKWSMIKYKGQYNTVISNISPGDLIFRSQTWKGTINGTHESGSTEISVTGIQTEIADRWHSSRDIPPQGQERNHVQSGCSTLIVQSGATYDIVDHEPNARSQRDYTYGDRGDHDPDNPGWDDLIWKPIDEPTTKIFLRDPLEEALEDGEEFVIACQHWYVASVEHIGSQPQSTSFDTPRFCEGHKRDCFDFFHLAAGLTTPARFEMMLHVIANESSLQNLFAQKKIIPGDVLYHALWHNWYQVLPKYEDGQLLETEVSFADIARTLTVHDREEFDFFKDYFDFNNLWIVNNTNVAQSWNRPLITGIDSDGNLTTSSRSRYYSAEFVYYPGVAEQSVR